MALHAGIIFAAKAFDEFMRRHCKWLWWASLHAAAPRLRRKGSSARNADGYLSNAAGHGRQPLVAVNLVRLYMTLNGQDSIRWHFFLILNSWGTEGAYLGNDRPLRHTARRQRSLDSPPFLGEVSGVRLRHSQAGTTYILSAIFKQAYPPQKMSTLTGISREPHLMQYELAKLLLPIVLATGGYDADEESLAECRHIVDIQEQANEKDRTDWFVDLLGGDSHSSNTTARRREAQAGQLSGVHYRQPLRLMIPAALNTPLVILPKLSGFRCLG